MKSQIQEWSYFVFQLVGFGMMVVFALEALARAVITAVRAVRKVWREE